MNNLMEIFAGLGLMYVLAVVAMLMVIVAMTVDLVSGWRKAKQRGEARTSYGFSRSLTKFLIYEGILMISTCIDTLIHFALYDLTEWSYRMPMVTLLMGVVLCAVELWSVYEKAEQKERRRMGRIAQAAAAAIDRERLTELLTEIIKKEYESKQQTD